MSSETPSSDDSAVPRDEDDRDARAPREDDSREDNGGKRRKGLSRRAKIVLLVILALVIVAAIIWYIRYETHGQYQQSTNDARIQADAVTIAPRTNGYVAQVLVADNQNVAAGQPLVRIDARDYLATAAQAEAQIAVANAQTASGRAQLNEQYAAIAQARAQLRAAQAKAAFDAAEVARYAPLTAAGAETKEQLAKLRAAAVQSANDARAQAAALERQVRHIGSVEATIRQGEAQAQSGRAQLSAANVDVGAALIRAPIAGRVGDKTVTIGQYAQAGTRLMSIVPLDRLYVVANFKETQLALMRVGQPVTIEVDTLDGIALRGRVQSFTPGTGAQFSLIPPENATGNFTKIVQRVPVRIALEASADARKLLLPGLSVTVTVDTISAKGDLDKVREQQKQLRERTR